MTKPLIVCIDGPAGAGKSTVSRTVAREAGLTYLDTGAIYRSLAWLAREEGIDWENEAALAPLARSLPIRLEPDRVGLGGRDVTSLIRSPDISRGASLVSRHPAVRAALLDLQREAAKTEPGLVAEGRDTGTVVFPDAQLKIYLVATPRERALRRFRELTSKGLQAELPQVEAEIIERDRKDTERETAPLSAAPDAISLDTTGLSIRQVVSRILNLIEERRRPETP